MPKPFKKTDDNIAVGNDLSLFNPPMYDPIPNVSDKASGCQPATNNGIIGVATENVGVDAPGATIGSDVSATYHVSIG
jgi:hypothetical protein